MTSQCPLRGMTRIMLVLIPPHCDRTTAISRLTRIGIRARRRTILVGTRGTITEAERLQSRLSGRIARHVEVALDDQGVLHKACPPGG